MSGSIRVRFNRFPELTSRFPMAVQAVIGKAVSDAQAIAKAEAPVDTGNLRNSIEQEVESSGSRIQGIVYTDINYGPHQEYGTVHMAAHPFFTPAFERVAPGVRRALETIEEALR